MDQIITDMPILTAIKNRDRIESDYISFDSEKCIDKICEILDSIFVRN